MLPYIIILKKEIFRKMITTEIMNIYILYILYTYYIYIFFLSSSVLCHGRFEFMVFPKLMNNSMNSLLCHGWFIANLNPKKLNNQETTVIIGSINFKTITILERLLIRKQLTQNNDWWVINFKLKNYR